MKHPSSREFFAYWDEKRGDERAPDRSEIEPGAVRELLGDIFVLSYDDDAGFRSASPARGFAPCSAATSRTSSFSALFAPECRREIEDIIAVVAEELLGAVAGITATAEDGRMAHLELLLLPFNTRAHTPISLTGLLAPFGGGHSVLSDFKLTSFRYLAHPPQRFVPARPEEARDRARADGV